MCLSLAPSLLAPSLLAPFLSPSDGLTTVLPSRTLLDAPRATGVTAETTTTTSRRTSPRGTAIVRETRAMTSETMTHRRARAAGANPFSPPRREEGASRRDSSRRLPGVPGRQLADSGSPSYSFSLSLSLPLPFPDVPFCLSPCRPLRLFPCAVKNARDLYITHVIGRDIYIVSNVCDGGVSAVPIVSSPSRHVRARVCV